MGSRNTGHVSREAEDVTKTLALDSETSWLLGQVNYVVKLLSPVLPASASYHSSGVIMFVIPDK